MKADTILYNGVIYPVVPSNTVYEAVAIKKDKILAVGSLEDVKLFSDQTTKFYDLKGYVLLPGFIDSHAHLLDTGLLEACYLDLQEIKSLKQMKETIKKYAEGKEKDSWIICVNFDENRMEEQRIPTLEELDEMAPSHALYINHKSYHSALVNSNAIKILNYKEDLEGFQIDSSGNRKKGLLIKKANVLAKQKVASLIQIGDLERAYKKASEIAAKVGLTTIHCIEGGAYYSDAYPEYILNAKKLTFDPVLYFNTTDIEEVKKRKLTRMGGDILVDGSISSHSAALMESYADDSNTKGILYYNYNQLVEMIKKAHLNHIQISFHAIGDRAVEEILQAYEEVLIKFPRENHRHRIEHFGIPREGHILRAKKLGLAIATQPAFTYQKEKAYRKCLGNDRFLKAYPIKDFIDSGIMLGGGSDSLVSPMNPIFGIHAALNLPNKNQRITIEDAIKMYTIGAAALAFEEKEKGSIEIGKFADLVVLDRDIYSVPTDKIIDIKVVGTMFRGECVYGFDW